MKAVKLPHYLYTSSLFLLIFLTAVCIAISAADVIIQALTDKTSTGEFDYRNLIVVSGSYVLLVNDLLDHILECKILKKYIFKNIDTCVAIVFM
jgi:hypothetical protein